MKRANIVTIVLTVLLLGGCEDPGIETASPSLTLGVGKEAPVPCPLDDCAIDFGLVYVGNQDERTLVVGNSGTADLTVLAVTIEPDSGPFSLLDPALGAVEPSKSLDLDVAYAPQGEGEHAASLKIETDDPDHEIVEIRLTGNSLVAPMPQLQVCLRADAADQYQQPDRCTAPHELDFGETVLVPLGEPVPTPVVLRNLGDEILILHSVEMTGDTTPEFTFEPDPSGRQIDPIEPDGTAHEIELTVWYTPIDGGADDGLFRIASNDPDDREVDVHLLGQGIAPRICSDPLSLEFGRVAINHAASRSFTISNCGLLDLTIGTIGFHEQASAEFAFAALPLTPFDLAPDEGIEIEMIYTPEDTGLDGARVYMQSNDPAAESGYILLQGEGADDPVCDLEIVPERLNFGMVNVGESASRNVAIRNLGTAECHVIEVSDPDGDGAAAYVFSSLPLPGFAIGPGAQEELTVRYSPTDAGPHRANFTVISDDYFKPVRTVELYGNDPNVPECDIQVSPDQLSFGTVAFWRTAMLEVRVENRGAEPCVLGAIDFTPETDTAFTLAEAPSLPAQIPPSSETVLLVAFTPIDRRAHSGTLSVMSDDPDTPVQTVNLSGAGEELNLMVIPDYLDFGWVSAGCLTTVRSVTVYNIGNSSVEIQDVYLDAVQTDTEFTIRALEPSPPFTLGPAENFVATVRYAPELVDHHTGLLVIESSAALGAYIEVLLSGDSTDIATQSDVFQQLDHPMVDVLWVIDNSGSMIPYQQALAQNFSTFINWAITLDTDFQIGVITTEINAPETPADFFNIYPGILVFFPGYPKILTNDTPNLAQAFSRNVNVGTCCSDEQESGLHAAMLALSEPLVSAPAANGGFVREDAKLVIIMVSDEPEQSPAQVDFYVDFFRSIKGYRNDQLMDISVIVEDTASRYRFAQESTGGLFRDLDTSNWASTLGELGLDAFAARTQFPLSRQANPPTIVVTVDEHDGSGPQPVPLDEDESGDGFTYDQESNSIVFGDDVVPGRGATIQVDYETVCL